MIVTIFYHRVVLRTLSFQVIWYCCSHLPGSPWHLCISTSSIHYRHKRSWSLLVVDNTTKLGLPAYYSHWPITNVAFKTNVDLKQTTSKNIFIVFFNLIQTENNIWIYYTLVCASARHRMLKCGSCISGIGYFPIKQGVRDEFSAVNFYFMRPTIYLWRWQLIGIVITAQPTPMSRVPIISYLTHGLYLVQVVRRIIIFVSQKYLQNYDIIMQLFVALSFGNDISLKHWMKHVLSQWSQIRCRENILCGPRRHFGVWSFKYLTIF